MRILDDEYLTGGTRQDVPWSQVSMTDTAGIRSLLAGLAKPT